MAEICNNNSRLCLNCLLYFLRSLLHLACGKEEETLFTRTHTLHVAKRMEQIEQETLI